MEEREKSERSFRFFRRIYDFSMSTLILGIGGLLFGAKYLKMDMVLILTMILGSFLALCAWFMVVLGFTGPLNKIINAINQQQKNYAHYFNWLDFYTTHGFM